MKTYCSGVKLGRQDGGATDIETRKVEKMLLDEYSAHLKTSRLSMNTRIAYRHQNALFLHWLSTHIPEFVDGPVLLRNALIDSYVVFLRSEKKAKQSTINAALVAVSNFSDFVRELGHEG